MKFIHTSDWHLGRQFHNASLLEDQRLMLRQIEALITSHNADALIVSGDIFDRAVPPASAISLLDETIHRISQDLKTPVIMISGNHDSAERLGFASRLMGKSDVHILTDLHSIDQPIMIESKTGQKTRFYGIPYCSPEHVRQLIANNEKFQASNALDKIATEQSSPTTKDSKIESEAVSTNTTPIQESLFDLPAEESISEALDKSHSPDEPDRLDIKTYDQAHTFLVEYINKTRTQDANDNGIDVLLSHCFVAGGEACDSERPLSVGGTDQVSHKPMLSFDYVALGHLHGPQYRAKQHIRYSGSPLKYSFSEQAQRKSVTLVEFDGKSDQQSEKGITITELPITPRRDVRILEGELETLIADALKSPSDPAHQDYLMVRLTDQHAILDAMSKLRAVFPNILHLEKPGIMNTSAKQALKKEKLQQGELSMFSDFFHQTLGKALNSEQHKAIEDIIGELHHTSN